MRVKVKNSQVVNQNTNCHQSTAHFLLARQRLQMSVPAKSRTHSAIIFSAGR